VNPLVLVVDDEPDVEVLFRQQFRRDLRGCFMSATLADISAVFAASRRISSRRFTRPRIESLGLRSR
jgi:hypothetical protein